MAVFVRGAQREEEQLDELTGIPTMRLAIGFCGFGLLAALFLTPVLDTTAQRIAGLAGDDMPVGIDRTVTGSIAGPVTAPKGTKRYIIRRSVMQKNPAEPCFLYEDGTREGDC